MSTVKITRTLFVNAYANEPLNKNSLFTYTQSQLTNNNYVTIGTVTIEIEVDPMAVTAAQIKQIEAQVTDERAAHQARLTMFQSQINNLTCLEASHD